MKNDEKILLYVIIAFILLLFFKNYQIVMPPPDDGGGEGGGGGGGGGGGVTPIDGVGDCQMLAASNGYSYYYSPIYTQLSCSVYASSDCKAKGKVTNGVAYNDGIDCCVWNCKDGSSGGDGTQAQCTDSDGGIEPFKKGVVDVPRLAVMYPDACTNEVFNRYLHEWYCENGVAKMTTIDCWGTYGAVCGNGVCQQMPCEQIVSPNSQSDCDKGYPCRNTGEETYCKFVSSTASGNRCVCTIEPSSVNSCERSCWFNGYSSGYCYTGAISKNPCGFDERNSAGDSYCPIGDSMRTCCCR